MSDTNCCPFCGQEVETIENAPDWLGHEFPGLFGKIVNFLAKARSAGHTVSMVEIVEEVYANDVEGGPVHANASISATISRCRRDLQALGWDIYGPKTTRNGFMLGKHKEKQARDG